MREAVDYKTPRDVLMKKEEKKEGVFYGASFAGLTFDEVLKLADWAMSNPEKWPTIKAKLRNPQITCRELADKLGIDAGTISRHLRALKQLRKARA